MDATPTRGDDGGVLRLRDRHVQSMTYRKFSRAYARFDAAAGAMGTPRLPDATPRRRRARRSGVLPHTWRPDCAARRVQRPDIMNQAVALTPSVPPASKTPRPAARIGDFIRAADSLRLALAIAEIAVDLAEEHGDTRRTRALRRQIRALRESP